MEFASYLAGERWSDHPKCTHPLLAAMARLVNDYTSDTGRQRLVALIPSVIGLTSDDPHVEVHIAVRAATTALPVVAEPRQRVLAVSLLAAERVLAVLDAVDEAIVFRDRQGKARVVNQRAGELFDVDPDSFIGLPAVGLLRMINRLIELSLRNRFIVVALYLALAAWGWWALAAMPIDAIPDLADNQVKGFLVDTSLPGISATKIENKKDAVPFAVSHNTHDSSNWLLH
jgi:PAS domain-containing protein